MRAEIEKRVRKLLARGERRQFSTSDKCLICGRTFKSDNCPHSVEDNRNAIEEIYTSDILKGRK